LRGGGALLLDFHPRRYFPSTNTATTKSLPSSCVGTLANQADPHPHDRHDGEVWHC
jgi:hypothetical protein